MQDQTLRFAEVHKVVLFTGVLWVCSEVCSGCAMGVLWVCHVSATKLAINVCVMEFSIKASGIDLGVSSEAVRP